MNQTGTNQYGDIDERFQRAQKYFDKNAVGFEYEGGFKDIESTVTMKHMACGTVFQVTMIAIRHNPIRCPECYRREVEQARKRRQIEKEQAQAKKQHERAERKEQKAKERIEREAAKWHECPVCGTMTNRDKYCSDRCSNRAHNKNKEVKRRLRTRNADKGITIEKLYELEHGICYICGRKCNWNDYKIRNGAFIVGNTYPTIEHRIPLARGGTHTWDNVRLACWKCNTDKGTHSPLSFF